MIVEGGAVGERRMAAMATASMPELPRVLREATSLEVLAYMLGLHRSAIWDRCMSSSVQPRKVPLELCFDQMKLLREQPARWFDPEGLATRVAWV